MGRVVIIGGGITGLAAAWELQQHDTEYVVLEASDRLGGKISTTRRDGFVIEGAADSFLTQKTAAWQLCREIGLGDRLISTNQIQKAVYVLRGGKLHPFPRGMRLIVPVDEGGLLESDLLSDEGKRRMLAEIDVPAKTDEGDESLAAFVRRRFGQEALDVFGEMLAGIYTGNPAALSMQATFPQYLAQERTYGSLIKAARQGVPTPPAPNAPTSAFVTLPGGVQEMIEQLQTVLSGEIRLNTPVKSLLADGRVQLANGEILEAEAVILTAPANAAAPLVEPVLPELTRGICNIHTSSSVIVTLGFEAGQVERELDGTGFIVANTEPGHLRACTWSSTKIADRAPTGSVLIRVFLGGHRVPEDVYLPNDQLVRLAYDELQPLMGLHGQPTITQVTRWLDANHQYEVGHVERVAHLNALCPPWLLLAGAPYGGVGIPDCVRQGRAAATAALNATSKTA